MAVLPLQAHLLDGRSHVQGKLHALALNPVCCPHVLADPRRDCVCIQVRPLPHSHASVGPGAVALPPPQGLLFCVCIAGDLARVAIGIAMSHIGNQRNVRGVMLHVPIMQGRNLHVDAHALQ